MIAKEEKILVEFYKLCGEILIGEVKKEDVERITKAMIDTNQQKVMKKEFSKITDILSSKANKITDILSGEINKIADRLLNEE